MRVNNICGVVAPAGRGFGSGDATPLSSTAAGLIPARQRAAEQHAPAGERGADANCRDRLAACDMAALRDLAEACIGSADHAEGRTAFMEKRRPRFQGR